MIIYGKRITIISKIRFSIIMTLVFLMVLSIGMLSFNKVFGDNIDRYDNYFVHQGDTLWSIAKELNGEEMDVRKVLFDITKINKISDSHRIYPGQELILPIYN